MSISSNANAFDAVDRILVDGVPLSRLSVDPALCRGAAFRNNNGGRFVAAARDLVDDDAAAILLITLFLLLGVLCVQVLPAFAVAAAADDELNRIDVSPVVVVIGIGFGWPTLLLVRSTNKADDDKDIVMVFKEQRLEEDENADDLVPRTATTTTKNDTTKKLYVLTKTGIVISLSLETKESVYYLAVGSRRVVRGQRYLTRSKSVTRSNHKIIDVPRCCEGRSKESKNW
jgi:hypothetical protein